jgi:hypothetical protein
LAPLAPSLRHPLPLAPYLRHIKTYPTIRTTNSGAIHAHILSGSTTIERIKIEIFSYF